jgi:hypothetical protein
MFVQIIEGRTRDAAGIKRLTERWQKDLAPGATGYLGSTGGVTADGKMIAMVRFESEAAARANGDRPEQGAWWAEMSKQYDGDPIFTESSDVEDFLGGGSNDAGFVQVMKSAGVDRARVAKMYEQFAEFSSMRPDLIGGVRVWTGPGTCVEFNYFTSEADARAGEKQEMPPGVQKLMEEFEDVMKDTEFLDLTDPILH